MLRLLNRGSFGAVMILFSVTAAARAGQAGDDSWSGFEVGGHVGYNWSHTDSTSINTVTSATEGTGSSDTSHVQGGAQATYQRVMPSHLVVGASAGVSFVGLDDTTTTSSGQNNSHTNETKTDTAGTVVGRLGYAARSTLIYGNGGWAWSTGSATRTQVTGTTGNATPGTVETLTVHRSTWTVGGGLAEALSAHVNVGAEYRYTPNSHTNTFPLAQRSTSSTGHTHGAQLLLNYRF
jgi:outer membrane immunogenic protein